MDDGQAEQDARHAGIDLPPDPTSVRVARSFVASVLDGWEVDDPELIVGLLTSEVVTNAVRHAVGAIRVDVSMQSCGVVRVETTDDHPGDPVMLPLDVARTQGRGIELVDSLARSWGVHHRDELKGVWFDAPVTRRQSLVASRRPGIS